MTYTTLEAFQPRLVRFVGAMHLLQLAAGVFTQLYARGSLVARGDPAQTAQNIIESERLFRIGIASDIYTYRCCTWGFLRSRSASGCC